jgi:amino acid transporter
MRGWGNIVAMIAILLVELRLLGAASFIFTGATRLPMTAGWDHLVPEWFTRMHPRWRTPSNSIPVCGWFGAFVLNDGQPGSACARGISTADECKFDTL